MSGRYIVLDFQYSIRDAAGVAGIVVTLASVIAPFNTLLEMPVILDSGVHSVFHRRFQYSIRDAP